MTDRGFTHDIPPGLSHGPLRLGILAILVIAAGLASTIPALANANNPTSIEDCRAQTQQFDSRISSLRAQVPQCIAMGGRYVMVPQCGYPANQSCVPLEAQICQLVDQKFAARDMCMERLQLHWQSEAEERRRQADEQRAEAARQREEAELERAQGDPMAAATNVQIGAVAGGLGAAAAGGIPVGLPIGALHLSNEFSAIGGAAANRIRMDSLNQLENALNAALGMSTEGAGPNASSPYERRPTQAQIAYELNAPLDQAERADALQGHLPFGGESAVVGANAPYLTDLAYARANGVLTTPLSQTQVQSAIGAGGVTGGQGATLAIIEDDEPPRQAPEYQGESLQQQRLASLADVQARLESERLAEVERQRAMQEQHISDPVVVIPPVQSPTEVFSKPTCVDVDHLISVPGQVVIDNNCPYSVSINLTNENFAVHGRNVYCGGAVVIPPGRSTNDYGVLESQIWGCVKNITAQ